VIEPLGAGRPARRWAAGFTLLEVLIALALLGGALVTLELVATTVAFRQASRENETLAQGPPRRRSNGACRARDAGANPVQTLSSGSRARSW
jgi:prepilin-type N-terminal cleavage/methylation domain-containing protein